MTADTQQSPTGWSVWPFRAAHQTPDFKCHNTLDLEISTRCCCRSLWIFSFCNMEHCPLRWCVWTNVLGTQSITGPLLLVTYWCAYVFIACSCFTNEMTEEREHVPIRGLWGQTRLIGVIARTNLNFRQKVLKLPWLVHAQYFLSTLQNKCIAVIQILMKPEGWIYIRSTVGIIRME